MGKKILYDYILIMEDGVYFHANTTFGAVRNIIEASQASNIDEKKGLYSPKNSFSSFFHFLDRTYCYSDGYSIYNHALEGEDVLTFHKKSRIEKFEDMLYHHIVIMSNDKPILNNKCAEFYKEAHDRFSTAVMNKKLEEKKAQDLLDEESSEK